MNTLPKELEIDPSRTVGLRRDEMKTPDDVSAMLKLQALGWGAKRIAAELGCSRNTVRRWLKSGGWQRPASSPRPKTLDGLEEWIAERFVRHAGNADVMRQELLAEKEVTVSEAHGAAGGGAAAP